MQGKNSSNVLDTWTHVAFFRAFTKSNVADIRVSRSRFPWPSGHVGAYYSFREPRTIKSENRNAKGTYLLDDEIVDAGKSTIDG